MRIFQAWTPPGAGQRQNRSTLHLAGLEADPGVAHVRRADQVVQRHPVGLASGSSSSRVGRRCPFSSRDSVLLEMPVRSDSSIRVIAAVGADLPQPRTRPGPGLR